MEIGKRLAEFDAEQKRTLSQHDGALLPVQNRPVGKKRTKNVQRQDIGILKTEEQIFSGEPFKNDSLGG
jgi:hypothetical protein